MPTTKQFLENMAASFQFGLNNNDEEEGYNVRGSAMAGSQLKRLQSLASKQDEGIVIGHFETDPVTGDLKVIVHKEENDKDEN